MIECVRLPQEDPLSPEYQKSLVGDHIKVEYERRLQNVSEDAFLIEHDVHIDPGKILITRFPY